MKKVENSENRFERHGLYLPLCLLASRCAALLLSFYALYFIGSAIIRIDFYDCAASPLLLIIIAGWRKLNEIYDPGAAPEPEIAAP